ncbi:MAG: tRNA (guanosine(37)-N1)-methyltransferase TrmD [Candidatus Aureabacteria bacterium]|nr:tRNA (guanosine(37)-N1)-methyltransferase TrmD [Candidatus Auribacterota bacterium]
MASPQLTIDVLTLFPGMFAGYFDESIMKRAREKGILALTIHNLRDWATDRHHAVDDTPYGGGAGMVMMVNVLHAAVQSLRREGSRVVLLSPQGRVFNQGIATELSRTEHLIFISGHYEGFDERVRHLCVDDELSVGDYVISNGSLAAMLVIDAAVRLFPGVVGDERSVQEDSFAEGILDYPHYTRPRVFQGIAVPDVLLSGDHEEVRRWRRREALRRTRDRRPDLLPSASLTPEDRAFLREFDEEQKRGKESDQ